MPVASASPVSLRIRGGAILLAIALALITAQPASAGPTISEFHTGLSSGSRPYAITAGPDGNLWFTDRGTTGAIGRITPTGAIGEFTVGLNPGSLPQGIAAGPDGNLWFTDRGTTKAIGRITPGGTITEFPLNAGSSAFGIVAGPDGSLFFADAGSPPAIGRINPTTHAIDHYSTGLLGGSRAPVWITAGPDGNLWFTDQGSPAAIGRINPATQVINEFTAGLPSPSDPELIATGSDANLWFTDDDPEAIGRITPAGGISEFTAGLQPSSAHSPLGIAAGPDGNLWFTDDTNTGAIGRISPTTQVVSEFSAGLNPGSQPEGIAAGPDGSLWFADEGNGSPSPAPAIGRITTGFNGFTIKEFRCASARCRAILVKVLLPGSGILSAKDARAAHHLRAIDPPKRKKRHKRLVKPTTVSVALAGTTKLRVRLSRAGKKLLKQKGKVRDKLRITYTPTDGTPNSKKITVTFKPKKKKH